MTYLQGFARDNEFILWDKDKLQIRYIIYKGATNDPANYLADSGEFSPAEPGHAEFYKANNRRMGECKVTRRNEMFWEIDSCSFNTGPCKKTGAGVACPQYEEQADSAKLKEGDYTYVIYWRMADGEPWKTMHVFHTKLESISSGSGRFKQAAWYHQAEFFERQAALVLHPGGDVKSSISTEEHRTARSHTGASAPPGSGCSRAPKRWSRSRPAAARTTTAGRSTPTTWKRRAGRARSRMKTRNSSVLVVATTSGARISSPRTC